MTKFTGISIAAIGLALTASSPASAQIAGSKAFESPVPLFKDLGRWDPNYKAPRTSDGKPDLQGVWSMASLTTMTRPREFSELTISSDKIAEITANAFYNQRLVNDSKPTDPNAGAGDGQGGGDVKGYNNFWIDPGSEYAKVDGEYRSSWIVSPASGQVPFSAEGRKARASRMTASRSVDNTGAEIRSIGDRCLISFASQAGPPLTNAMYNNHYQIVQSPSAVMINTEMNHDVRIAQIGGDPRPTALKQWFGDSVARWEGETLVVETQNIHPVQERAGAFPISENGRVTEKFTRVSEAELFYQFTVDDPVYYAEPWSGEIPLRRSNEKVYEYACHEGNYALPGILRGMSMGLDTALGDEGE